MSGFLLPNLEYANERAYGPCRFVWFDCMLVFQREDTASISSLILALSAIGFGSVAFHGTLLRVSQATDELPMIGLSLISCTALLYVRFFWTPAQARRKTPLGGEPRCMALRLFWPIFG